MLRPEMSEWYNSREHTRKKPINIASLNGGIEQNESIIYAINCFVKLKNDLSENFHQVTVKQLLVLLVLREWIANNAILQINKPRAFEDAISNTLAMSNMTFNRIFNQLVMLNYFNALGHRGSGEGSLYETYVPTMKFADL